MPWPALPKNARGPEQPAVQFIELIAKLYAVESRARKLEMDAQQRLHQRQEHSVPVIEAIKALLLAHLHAVVPGSALGKALHYFSSQWPKLVRYVEDARYPIDNNHIHADIGMTGVMPTPGLCRFVGQSSDFNWHSTVCKSA